MKAILNDGFLININSDVVMQIDITKLQGQYVYLELIQASHVEELKTLAKDERLWEYTKTILIDETYDEQIDKYLTTALDPNGMGLQRSFVIHDAATKQAIGMTRYYRIEPAHKRLDIGYTWYAPSYWGKVHNKECKLLLLQYAFEILGFQRVEFEVAHQNIRSQKAVEKIGGQKEGVLRKHGLRGDGSIRHTVIFSIIDDEWTGVKQMLEGKLTMG